MDDLDPTECFDHHLPRVVPALCGAFVFAIGLNMLRDSTSTIGVVFTLLGSYIVLNALRQPSVVVDQRGATTRSILRTHRYPFRELQSVEVAEGRTGFPHFGREHLVFHQSNGRNRAFKQLMSRPPKDDPTNSVVRRAAVSIEARLSLAGGRLR